MASQMSADEVRRAVTSTSTCSPATAAALRALLIPKVAATSASSSAERTTTKAPAAKISRTTKAKPVRGKPAVSEAPADALSPKDRSILATEVINSTLKALGDAAKTPAARSQESKDAPKNSKRTLRRSSTSPQSPLQPRALNRIESSPSLSNRASRPPPASTAEPGLRSVAECAHISFACLRSLQASKTSPLKLAELHLENGMSALIGKLLSLGLDDMALRELRLLRRRLDLYTKSTKPASRREKDTSEALNLSGLLDFSGQEISQNMANLVASTQLQVLKLVASSKKPSHIESVLPKLRRSNQNSVIGILEELAKDPLQTAKATRQMDSLSQLMLSLCPSISSSDDTTALAPRLSPNPEAALQIQSQAFCVRLSWWIICDHRGDLGKDILEPFSRCLTAFTRRSSQQASSFKCGILSFEQLWSAIQTYKLSKTSLDHILINIYKALGSLAQDAGMHKEAVEWIEKAQSKNAAASDVQRCAVAARLASLNLSISVRDTATESLLIQVIDGLEGPLKGESAAIDELLSEVSTVRRATMIYLTQPDGNSKSKSAGIRQVCESLIYLCPKFCVRYLGKRPPSNAPTKQMLHYEKRRQYLSRMAPATIDAALYLVKTTMDNTQIAWELVDSVLQDCLSLLDQIEQGKPSPSADEGSTSSHYVKISHIYYARYLGSRQDATTKTTPYDIRPLRRSIDCVRRRPAVEKKAAIFAAKLERAAELYKTTGRFDDACDALQTIRDEAISNGVLDGVVSLAATKPSHISWTRHDEAGVLARTIGSLVKLQLRRDDGQFSFELPDSLSAEERGLMLEFCLDSLLSQVHQPKIHDAVSHVLRKLLDIYEIQVYPVRRLRAVTRVYLFDPELYVRMTTEADDIRRIIQHVNPVRVQGSRDAGLQAYQAHLRGFLQSIHDFRGEPNMDSMKQSLAAWTRMLESCKDETALQSQIDNISDFLGHLRSLADFLDMKGIGPLRIVTLKLIIGISGLLSTTSAADDIVNFSCQLSSQYLELGYSGKSGLVLDKTKGYAELSTMSGYTALRFRVSYAEYFLTIGNLQKCEEYLGSGADLLATTIADAGGSGASRLLERNLQNRLISEAHTLCALLALEYGSLDVALLHAKASVRLLWRSWTNAEHEAKKLHDKSDKMDKLSHDLAALNLSNPESAKAPMPAGSFFWPLVYGLFRGLSQLSSIFAHHGMYQETMYYAEQARKIVATVNSEIYTSIATAQVGQIFLKGGVKSSAKQYLGEAQELTARLAKDRYTAMTLCLLGGMHRIELEPEDACTAYEQAVATIDQLMQPSYIRDVDRIMETDLEDELAKLTITKKAPARKGTTRARTTRKPPARKTPAISVEVSSECPELSSFKSHILRQKAHTMVLWRKFADALDILQQAESGSLCRQDAVEQHIGMARRLLEHSLEMMVADPIYSMLQESTISFPSVSSSVMDAEKAITARSVSRQGKPKAANAHFTEMLQQAHEHLLAAYGIASQVSSTSVCHTLSSLLSSTVILLSAAGFAKGKSFAHLGIASCSVDMSRISAYRREHATVRIDAKDIDDCQWPVLPSATLSSPHSFSADLANFQADYVDIIPAPWITISISLSESHDELCITRLQAGHSPFVLRLPLGRQSSRDAEEECFGFDEGRAEMREISKLADETAHSGGDLTGKLAKKAWWNQRMNLDLRLKDLLDNVERVWLGGFRGIFSQHSHRPELLARFQRNFQTVLDKHLPSRQKMGRKAKSKTTHVSLDPRILELFIGLGDASLDDCDIDEPLTDLLYFVIDVLQFHGERNAYDEIDFDAIAVETLDLLRGYHAAVKSAPLPTDDGKHTILILDKALHCFPWESLPCMDGLAVSRLPSLESLRSSILAQKATCARPGHYIDRQNGTYILNPDGDLKSTQETFQRDLQDLPRWTAITQRAPSEEEFETHLGRADLVLYFGHGSGAQYIRSKTIKRLERCAVALLMGCSSGVLTYTHDFEVYGPVMDYLLAGSPAVVATLWDVTDRDVDRFAQCTFDAWGLFDRSPGDGRSLVEAVARGREACMLRYLTAAAVVVYGIPVYFQ